MLSDKLAKLGLSREAISKHVVSVEPPLPKSYAKQKKRITNLEKGLTSHGEVRKNPSPRSLDVSRRLTPPTATPAQSAVE